MIDFQEDFSLQSLNTFGIAAKTRYFFELTETQQIEPLLNSEIYQHNQVLWLGGGSNMLLTGDFNGLVVKIALTGRAMEQINEQETLLRAAAGENWHHLVEYAVQNNLGGIENLALIPGNVGTAPIQNIGAYGVELKDCFESLRAYDLQERRFVNFSREECQFGYRDSLFKRDGKGRYLILELSLRLRHRQHQVNTRYGSLRKELEAVSKPDIREVANAVIRIRQSKLPDPKEIGNSGSFFKNPVVPLSDYERLRQQFPDIVAYPAGDQKLKLAAGWLIEQAGWKGHRAGDAGVHKKQALVLVNYGEASGKEIEALAIKIQVSVFRKFAVHLEPEVNIIQ